MTEHAKDKGMLCDHTGKKSSSRFVAISATITFCALAIGQGFGYAPGAVAETLWILAGMAVAPQGINRWMEQKAVAETLPAKG